MPATTTRGDLIVTNGEGAVTIERAEHHFRWGRIDGRLNLQQLYAVRPLTSNVWRGEWRTL